MVSETCYLNQLPGRLGWREVYRCLGPTYFKVTPQGIITERILLCKLRMYTMAQYPRPKLLATRIKGHICISTATPVIPRAQLLENSLYQYCAYVSVR